MAPGSDMLPPSSQELSSNDLRKHEEPLPTALDTLCGDPIFRNSPRSCEFIRHVVYRTLEGNTDELKERLIGMSLLGRDASYDTSTDSGVRVRANDVRKRLTKYNDARGASLEFTIVLAIGTYVPRFFHAMEMVLPAIAPTPALPALPTKETVGIVEPTLPPVEALEIPFVEATFADELPSQAHSLAFLQLAVPTLAAVFLCIVCMRWQLAQEQFFANFWQEILHGDQALLYLKPSQSEGKQGLIAIQELNEAAPLLDLAGQFHRRLTMMNNASTLAQGHTAVYVGLDAGADLHTYRYVLVNTARGRVVVDSKSPSRPVFSHAALLTIVNGTQPAIYIDGTDDSAIRSLVSRLCDESTFPRRLTASFRPGTTIQGVFPVESHTKTILDQEPLITNTAALEYQP